MKKILFVFPHPDDESFTSGGTVAKYVNAGWEAHLVCATRGEVGAHGEYEKLSSDELGDIRQKELEKAGKIIGLSSITFLGFKDGTLPNKAPGEIEEGVYKEIVRLAPDIIITFEPKGISNHPDHQKLTISTTFAFQKYAKDIEDLPKLSALRGPRKGKLARTYRLTLEECLAMGDAPKLYYACMPESLAIYLKKKKVIPEELFGKPWTGTPDKCITTVIDIARFKKKKIEALHAHKTQSEDVSRFFSLPNNPLLTKEYFILRMSGEHEVFMGNEDRVGNKL